MSPSIAFVGAGPTTLYTLSAFLKSMTGPAEVTIYEEQGRAGLGMPYRPGWNDPAMLSNIASVEIPEIGETLIEWLRGLPRARLVRLGIDPDGIDDHAFYPRLALGEYFLDKFTSLVNQSEDQGVVIDIATRCRVMDISASSKGLSLHVAPAGETPFERSFDHVVLATGHQWPEEPEVKPGFFASPWPASALKRIGPTTVAIRGSSLTAIDAAVALATAHGSFIETDGAVIDYRISPGAEAFKIVMMSRKGLLPEADFFHPLPYAPLQICTPDAMAQLIKTARGDLLEQAFALFKTELMQADPAYADQVGLGGLTLDDFADHYFEARSASDPFDWAATNLAEARANYENQVTVGWRYAILRMHEVIALIVPHLSPDDLDRFNRDLKPIFVDEYATVPHLSIERLLALRRSGHLDVMALGDTYSLDTSAPEPGATVVVDATRLRFPVLIDATGQRPLAIDAFPFATLVKQGVVRDAAEGDPDGPRGIAVDANFHPSSKHDAANRIYCLSIPFILDRHPFIQGITSSHEMGEIVGADLAERSSREDVSPAQLARSDADLVG